MNLHCSFAIFITLSSKFNLTEVAVYLCKVKAIRGRDICHKACTCVADNFNVLIWHNASINHINYYWNQESGFLQNISFKVPVVETRICICICIG